MKTHKVFAAFVFASFITITIGENDRGEITGKLESGLGHAVIDIKSIRKP